jgi:hypothetical protein
MHEKGDTIDKTVHNLKNVFKINFNDKTIQERWEKFFLTIPGVSSYKENFFRALDSEEQVNILIMGCNISLKNKFISHIKDQCHDVFYFDALTTNGSKLINDLYNNRFAKVIIIVNIDKLRKNYLDSLSSYLDDGSIKQKSKSKRNNFRMEGIKVFATAKNLEKFSPQLRSRSMEYVLPD